MLWENVPGAFSSNNGEDFRIVLEETAKIADENATIPRPPGKWTNAGCILGNGWSIAWRVFNAQFWGVPQRRRRIALIADFGGHSAPEILFERESVSGDSEKSGETQESAARILETGTAQTGRKKAGKSRVKNLTPGESQSSRIYDSSGVFPTLCARENSGLDRQAILCMAHSMPHAEICKDLSPTLTCHHEQPFIHFAAAVRRLTPLECERLQGYPDGWTDIGNWTDSKGKVHKTSDSTRYKALGNSIALPSWRWVLCRLSAYCGEHPTMASLFDGIGGFPLLWEQINGQGSCLWTSEIEEFPIAVTQKRFQTIQRR